MNSLSKDVINIMTREMGQLGYFIVKKQCEDLGIDVENMDEDNIHKLANALYKVMLTFGGETKAEDVKRAILSLRKTEAV